MECEKMPVDIVRNYPPLACVSLRHGDVVVSFDGKEICRFTETASFPFICIIGGMSYEVSSDIEFIATLMNSSVFVESLDSPRNSQA